ncbi:MAG: hypothetical protein FWG11_07815, partial [Promicromonosporaceae bacterium]|nr:hypothetical protein [Promicromonosporaceae bacterium]
MFHRTTTASHGATAAFTVVALMVGALGVVSPAAAQARAEAGEDPTDETQTCEWVEVTPGAEGREEVGHFEVTKEATDDEYADVYDCFNWTGGNVLKPGPAADAVGWHGGNSSCNNNKTGKYTIDDAGIYTTANDSAYDPVSGTAAWFKIAKVGTELVKKGEPEETTWVVDEPGADPTPDDGYWDCTPVVEACELSAEQIADGWTVVDDDCVPPTDGGQDCIPTAGQDENCEGIV